MWGRGYMLRDPAAKGATRTRPDNAGGLLRDDSYRDRPVHALKPRRIVIGPAFRDIANTLGMTATALRVFLNREVGLIH